MKIFNLVKTQKFNSGFYKFPIKTNLEIIKSKVINDTFTINNFKIELNLQEPSRINELIIHPQNELASWNHNCNQIFP